MRRFRVSFERDETGWWIARVKDAPAAITQGRTLAEARRRIREALAVTLDSSGDARNAALIEEIRMPRIARRALQALAVARTRLTQETDRVSAATDAALSGLLDGMRLSVRDAGELLGLSHQRVQQLKAGSRREGRRGRPIR